MALNLIDLPEELLNVVVSWLATADEERWDSLRRSAVACKTDLAALSLVSSLLRRLASPFLFEKVRLKRRKINRHETHWALDLFHTPFASLVKHLSVPTEFYVFDGFRDNEAFVQGAIVALTACGELQSIELAYSDVFLKNHTFRQAIATHPKLQAVLTETISWPPRPIDSEGGRVPTQDSAYLKRIVYRPFLHEAGHTAKTLEPALESGLRISRIWIVDAADAKHWASLNPSFLDSLEDVCVNRARTYVDSGATPSLLKLAEAHPRALIKIGGGNGSLVSALAELSPFSSSFNIHNRVYLSRWRWEPRSLRCPVAHLTCIEVDFDMGWQEADALHRSIPTMLSAILSFAEHFPSLERLYFFNASTNQVLCATDKQTVEYFNALSKLAYLRKVTIAGAILHQDHGDSSCTLLGQVYDLACQLKQLEMMCIAVAKRRFVVERDVGTGRVQKVYTQDF